LEKATAKAAKVSRPVWTSESSLIDSNMKCVQPKPKPAKARDIKVLPGIHKLRKMIKRVTLDQDIG
jgi:hypothetical protein